MDDATARRLRKADADRIRQLQRETAALRRRLCAVQEQCWHAEAQAAYWRQRASGYVAVETGERGMWRAALLRLAGG